MSVRITPAPIAVCQECGKQYFQHRKNRKFCSDECLRSNMRKRKKTKFCTECGKAFEVMYNSHIECCDECKKKIREKRKHETEKLREEKKRRQQLAKRMKDAVAKKKAQDKKKKKPKEEEKKPQWTPIKPDDENKKVYARMKVDPARLVKPIFPYETKVRISYEGRKRAICSINLSNMSNTGAAYKKSSEVGFTEEEDRQIVEMVKNGVPYKAIGDKLGRHQTTVRIRANQLMPKSE